MQMNSGAQKSQHEPQLAYRNLKGREVNLAYPTKYRHCLVLRFETITSERNLGEIISDYEAVIIKQGDTPTIFILDMTNLRLTVDIPVMRLINMSRTLLPAHLQIVLGAPQLVVVYSKLILSMAHTNVEFAMNLPEAIAIAQQRCSDP